MWLLSLPFDILNGYPWIDVHCSLSLWWNSSSRTLFILFFSSITAPCMEPAACPHWTHGKICDPLATCELCLMIPLSYDFPYLGFRKTKIVLHLNISFLSKVISGLYLNQDLIFPTFFHQIPQMQNRSCTLWPLGEPFPSIFTKLYSLDKIHASS